ncbi:hypothetical protein ACEOWJ_003875 [Bacillus cereus]|uniref:hypothetical protein n=1 Tax=Bacillus sp. UNC322MFChir4.1 TaxID=1449045 RepID=UPI000AD38018|nr:hypothetical protein [Bacillus sp. UNC322MFChir4.1]
MPYTYKGNKIGIEKGGYQIMNTYKLTEAEKAKILREESRWNRPDGGIGNWQGQ